MNYSDQIKCRNHCLPKTKYMSNKQRALMPYNNCNSCCVPNHNKREISMNKSKGKGNKTKGNKTK